MASNQRVTVNLTNRQVGFIFSILMPTKHASSRGHLVNG